MDDKHAKDSGVEHKDVGADPISSIIRLIALCGGGYLFVQDVYLHNIAPVSLEVYGIIAGIASGNDKLLSLIGLAKSKH